MRTKYIVLTLIFIFSFSHTYSQDLSKKKYVVITFEDNNNKDIIRIKGYFWVVPFDSIKSYENIFYPLYISAYSKKQFDDCNAGTGIDPVFKPGENGFDYTWDDSHDKLYELIRKKRKLIQTIKKNWETDGAKKVIKIYATPLIGEFCSCELSKAGQKRNGYKGKIYLAWNFAEGYPDFWNSAFAHYILKQDYSRHEFCRNPQRIE